MSFPRLLNVKNLNIVELKYSNHKLEEKSKKIELSTNFCQVMKYKAKEILVRLRNINIFQENRLYIKVLITILINFFKHVYLLCCSGNKLERWYDYGSYEGNFHSTSEYAVFKSLWLFTSSYYILFTVKNLFKHVFQLY